MWTSEDSHIQITYGMLYNILQKQSKATTLWESYTEENY